MAVMGRDKDPHSWALRDVDRMLGLFFLLVLAGLHIFFFYVLLLVLAAIGARVLVLAHRRRQLERANADAPFWLDQVRNRDRSET